MSGCSAGSAAIGSNDDSSVDHVGSPPRSGRLSRSLQTCATPFPDVLVVAGDVCEGDTDGALRKVRYFANDKPAVFVLGNHEFWGRDVARERRTARRAAERHGVVLLDDSVADVAGLRFVGGTLWADGALAGDAATPELPTGERIRVGSSRRPITGADEMLLHRQTLQVIRNVTAEDGPPLVVVTHHAPHALCLPEANRCGWAAGNAASDLSALTDSGRIACGCMAMCIMALTS